MYYYLRALRNKRGDELTTEFAKIPVGVTSLDLSINCLSSKTDDELIRAFAAIPASVTSLNLYGNSLSRKNGAALAIIFAAIPASVTSLDLGGNSLKFKTGAELMKAFVAIPAGVTSLNLSGNGLGYKTNAELITAFAAIPAGIITITLSERDIMGRSSEELIALGRNLPHMINIHVTDDAGNPSKNTKADELRLHIGGAVKIALLNISTATSLPNELVKLLLTISTGANPKDLEPLLRPKKLVAIEPTASSSLSNSSAFFPNYKNKSQQDKKEDFLFINK